MRRKMLAVSQSELGDALGITYQQGLQQISHILQVR
jgi:hypothetical protein